MASSSGVTCRRPRCGRCWTSWPPAAVRPPAPPRARHRYNSRPVSTRFPPDMIVLEGLPALSPFRLERLQARISAIAPDLRVLGAWFTYWVEPEPGAAPDLAVLGRILQAGEASRPLSEIGRASRRESEHVQ